MAIPSAVGLTNISSHILHELSTYTFPQTSTVTSTGLTGEEIEGGVAGAEGLWEGSPYPSLGERWAIAEDVVVITVSAMGVVKFLVVVPK